MEIAMLEHGSLLMHSWIQKADADGSPAWIRAITETTGRPLGFVRRTGNPSGSWFFWFRKVRLDVFETDDASHLMSVSRSWGMTRMWEVDDAEDRHVGTIQANAIVSSDGEPLASIERESNECVLLCDYIGRPLASFGTTANGVELVFASPSNPFVRMLVLGSVLAQDPAPNR
jgi:hypothetical protein